MMIYTIRHMVYSTIERGPWYLPSRNLPDERLIGTCQLLVHGPT